MEIKKYEVVVNNELDIVFNKLFEQETYTKWTKDFAEGSIIEGEIKQDSIVYFFDKERNGMKGIVKEYINLEKVTFNYISNIINGKEDPVAYPDNYESYSFSKMEDGLVKINIELCLPKEYVSYMEAVWPKAIENIKQVFNK